MFDEAPRRRNIELSWEELHGHETVTIMAGGRTVQVSVTPKGQLMVYLDGRQVQ